MEHEKQVQMKESRDGKQESVSRRAFVGTAAAAAVGLAAVASRTAQAQDDHAGHAHAAGEMGMEGGALQAADVSEALAHKALMAAHAKAKELGTKMDIAVVDAGANLKAFTRMDGAWIGSIDISIKKARTARFFDMPTGDIGGLSQPGGALYNIEHSNGGLITFPGGVPLKDAAGNVIGAIGVSGSSVDNDHACAAAGAAAIL